MQQYLNPEWQEVLAEQFELPYWSTLEGFVAQERSQHTVFPAQEQVFSAFNFTPYSQVKVLVLGQDPYFNPNQAHGLAFSVQEGVKVPPSLVNIYKELESDLGIARPKTGYLKPWADQGVMLLNTALTVRAGQANSHKGQGWEILTDAVIKAVNAKPHVVFVLWGANAQKKQSLIDSRHTVVASAHPSPLSARNGFFGSKPFSRVNAALEAFGQTPINWQLYIG